MTAQLFYSLLAISTGFVAGVCFCIGAVLTSRRQIIAISTPRYDYNRKYAKLVTSQTTQYLTGAILLGFSFSLQVVAVQASPNTPIKLPLVPEQPWYFVLYALVLLGFLSFCFYKILNKHRKRKVLQELEATPKQC